VNSDVASGTLLSVATGISVFTSLLPPLADVRKSVGDVDMIHDVRLGELASFGLVTSVGITASSLTNSPVPAMLSIVAALALVCMYESVLQATPTEKKVAR
jgi:hypothetical protein